MTGKTPEKKNTRRNAALALILGLVMVWRVAALAGFLADAPTKKPASRKPVVAAKESPETETTAAGKIDWPEFQLEAAVEHDPFALAGTLLERSRPATSPDDEIVPQEAELALQESKESFQRFVESAPVRAIVHGPDGLVAVLDSGPVRPGDHINPHVRVVAIDRRGVVVEMVDPAVSRSDDSGVSLP